MLGLEGRALLQHSGYRAIGKGGWCVILGLAPSTILTSGGASDVSITELTKSEPRSVNINKGVQPRLEYTSFNFTILTVAMLKGVLIMSCGDSVTYLTLEEQHPLLIKLK